MRRDIIVLLVLVGVMGFACTKGSDKGTENPAGSAAHAPASATPGSYEDWCQEHQVPESLCTKCNPSLVAAFQASDDWCKEHGLPESQCRACNPSLQIVRPSKSGEK
ncbi:MAG: hypothetical protein HY292_26970 [Planctomycetes bacterium]|nr:hypothetical protein [Planctomycetota bacterium]